MRLNTHPWLVLNYRHVTAGADQWILPIIVSEYLFMFGHRVTGYTRQDRAETGVGHSSGVPAV